MERLLDQAADELKMSRVYIRRKNLISANQIPFEAISGLRYDSGNFPAVLAAGLAHADWDGFESRRATSRENGLLRRTRSCYLSRGHWSTST